MHCILTRQPKEEEDALHAYVCDHLPICGYKPPYHVVLVLGRKGWGKCPVLFPEDEIILNEEDGYVKAWRIARDLATAAGLLDNPLVKRFIGDWGALV